MNYGDIMSSPLAAYIVLPFTRLETPGWGQLYRWLLSSQRASAWIGTRTIRGKLHGFKVVLDLSNWSERLTYFLGRYYDLPTQRMLMSTIQPGDRVLDVGANIGMITLLMARLVGPCGIVEAFEPNPRCVSRIRELIRINRIGNVRLHACALGNSDEESTLSIIPSDSGMSTICEVLDPAFSVRVVVPMRHRDSLVRQDPRPVRVIKIDVEGSDCSVLDGLRETISRDRPLIVAEMIASHLKRARKTRADIIDRMNSYGYRGLKLASSRRLGHHSLALRDLNDDSVDDAVWFPPEWSHRLTPFSAN